MSFVCDEIGHTKDGYTNLGTAEAQWWVCGACKRPTKDLMRWKAKNDMLLNFFRGGPLNGLAYKTSDLLLPNAIVLRVDLYDWTPETITSEKTGKQARVWVYNEEKGAQNVQPGERTQVDASAGA